MTCLTLSRLHDLRALDGQEAVKQNHERPQEATSAAS
jgi:hypothetical protein